MIIYVKSLFKSFFKTTLNLLTYVLKFSFSDDHILRPGWGKDEKVTKQGGFARRLVQVFLDL